MVRFGQIEPLEREGLIVERTELEHAVFAVHAPSLPSWTDWSLVPGGGTTDAKPNACVDYSGNLHLFVKQQQIARKARLVDVYSPTAGGDIP